MDLHLIDIHTHILPGLDDGARDLEQAVAMAAVAVRDGVHSLVATPHVMRGRYDYSRAKILKHVADLNLCLQVQQIKLPILPGAEYCLEQDLPQRLAAGQLLTLNDTGRYLLVEFPASGVPEYAGNVLQGLLSQGITPILAHPERNHRLVKEPDILERLVARGILAQVTSVSITGLNGREVQESALKFIQAGLVQLVASDAHSAHRRPPLMAAAYAEVEQRWGLEFAQLLFCRNPWRVVRGLPLLEVVPPQAAAAAPPPKLSWKTGFLPKKLRMPWG